MANIFVYHKLYFVFYSFKNCNTGNLIPISPRLFLLWFGDRSKLRHVHIEIDV